jgi:hypothetical protein
MRIASTGLTVGSKDSALWQIQARVQAFADRRRGQSAGRIEGADQPRGFFKSTQQIADELIYAGALPAEELIEMQCSDPEWLVGVYVRRTAIGWALKKWLGAV